MTDLMPPKPAMPSAEVIRRRRTVLAGAAAVLFLLALVALTRGDGGSSGVAAPGQPGGPKLAPGTASATVQVAAVTDPLRATVTAGGTKQEVRLVGLVTATAGGAECFTEQALAQAHRLLDGATVTLVTDSVQANTDGEGRTPAYLVLADGRYYDKTMVAEGFLRAVSGPPGYENQKSLQDAEERARKDKKGLWAVPGCGA